eukprot:jgi/Botrbrau1/6977/Bobra.0165s0013.1
MPVGSRAGCLDVRNAARGAAQGAQLECLKYLLNMYPGLVRRDSPMSAVCQSKAKPEAQVACLEFLQRCGCEWSADGKDMVESAGRPEVMRYCFERLRIRHWDDAMRESIARGSLKFEAECPMHSSWLTTFLAGGGEDMLQHMRELGVPFTIRTTRAAAGGGDVGALRWALNNGAPWDASTVRAVIVSSCKPSRVDREMSPDWLGCLRCLHEYARVVGFPKECRRPSGGAFAGILWKVSPGPTLAVLRYVCDHMVPAWATPLLESTAKKTGALAGGR